jgi:hypothetical protein
MAAGEALCLSLEGRIEAIYEETEESAFRRPEVRARRLKELFDSLTIGLELGSSEYAKIALAFRVAKDMFAPDERSR